MSDPLADFEEALDFYRDRCHEYADRANDEQFGDGSPVTTDRVYDSETKARAEVVRLFRASGVRGPEDGLREALEWALDILDRDAGDPSRRWAGWRSGVKHSVAVIRGWTAAPKEANRE